MATSPGGKKAVNVSISTELLRAARKSEINLSATLEAAVERELRLLRMRDDFLSPVANTRDRRRCAKSRRPRG